MKKVIEMLVNWMNEAEKEYNETPEMAKIIIEQQTLSYTI